MEDYKAQGIADTTKSVHLRKMLSLVKTKKKRKYLDIFITTSINFIYMHLAHLMKSVHKCIFYNYTRIPWIFSSIFLCFK